MIHNRASELYKAAQSHVSHRGTKSDYDIFYHANMSDSKFEKVVDCQIKKVVHMSAKTGLPMQIVFLLMAHFKFLLVLPRFHDLKLFYFDCRDVLMMTRITYWQGILLP